MCCPSCCWPFMPFILSMLPGHDESTYYTSRGRVSVKCNIRHAAQACIAARLLQALAQESFTREQRMQYHKQKYTAVLQEGSLNEICVHTFSSIYQLEFQTSGCQQSTMFLETLPCEPALHGTHYTSMWKLFVHLACTICINAYLQLFLL